MSTVQHIRIGEEQLDAALKALASSQRREIIRYLSACEPTAGKLCCAADEVCACKISDHLGLAASTISHHMTILREAGLVRARKEGTWVYYSLEREMLRAVAAALRDL